MAQSPLSESLYHFWLTHTHMHTHMHTHTHTHTHMRAHTLTRPAAFDDDDGGRRDQGDTTLSCQQVKGTQLSHARGHHSDASVFTPLNTVTDQITNTGR